MNRLLVALFAAAAFTAASAQTDAAFPSKPIRIVVPYTPGATNDTLPRLLAPKLAELLGQPVLVDNKPGAGGDIGVQHVAKSAPDGYTLLLTSNAAVVSAATKKQPLFNMASDFKPLVLVGSQPMILVAAADFPASTMDELGKLARSTPQGLSYATPGNATPHHLAMELINVSLKTNMVHIPFKGAAQALTETAAGRIAVTFGTPASAGPFITDRRVKVLAVAAPTRLPSLPNAPTFAEAGVPGLESGFWYGLTMPAGAPKPVVDKLTGALQRVLAMPEIRAEVLKLGIDGKQLDSAAFADLIGADMLKWKRIADSAAISTD